MCHYCSLVRECDSDLERLKRLTFTKTITTIKASQEVVEDLARNLNKMVEMNTISMLSSKMMIISDKMLDSAEGAAKGRGMAAASISSSSSSYERAADYEHSLDDDQIYIG
jgi:hypothetical protein